jgi:tetratricopeptide (TPR) repeat protein
MIQCGFCMAMADFDKAVDHLSEATRIGEELDVLEPKLFGMTHIANMQTFMARFDEALATGRQALALAREAGHKAWQAEVLSFSIPYCLLRAGDLSGAYEAALESYTIAREIGFVACEGPSAHFMGVVEALRGEYEQALTHQERSATASRLTGSPWFEVLGLCMLGTVNLSISPDLTGKGLEWHAKALQTLEQPGAMMSGATVWTELGFCRLRLGDVLGAREYFEKGLATPTSPMYLQRPSLLLGMALVSLAEGNTREAERFAAEARDYVEEKGMRHLRPFTALTEGRVKAAQGAHPAALAAYRSALETAVGMGMRPMELDARLGAAECLTALGQTTEAAEERRLARETVEETSRTFADERLRWLYFEAGLKRVG